MSFKAYSLVFASSLFLSATAPIGGTAFAAATPVSEGERYVIPETDGYGIGECLHEVSDCGRVMADSWCESHGHAHAIGYGADEDVTGSTTGTKHGVMPVSTGDVVIRCGD